MFLDNGYNVGLIGRNADTLAATADGHPNALVLPCDVGVPEEVQTSFDKAVDSWGRLDVLFNNAGRSSPARTIDETGIEDWLDVVRINLTGSFLCARAAFRIMRAQSPQGGRIINNGSISAHVPRPGSTPIHRPNMRLPADADIVARRAPFRHRLRTDRHRQRADRNGDADDEGRSSTRRLNQGRGHHGCRACRLLGASHGADAAGCERAVHDGDGAKDAALSVAGDVTEAGSLRRQ